MKLTARRKEIVMELMEKYAESFSIKMPKVWMTRKEVLDAPLYITKGRRTATHRYFGVCFRKDNVIFINVKSHPNHARIKKTIVHEIVHMRFPYLRHGKKFDSYIEKGLNGESFKPYKKSS